MKQLDANPRELCPDISVRKPQDAGFTLVELLVVIAVIVVMMVLAVPAFNAIRGSADFGTEVFDVAGTLDQARAYAMANNTYVLVGITEVTSSKSSSATPQTSGTGRVAMAVIASKDGMRPYQDLLNTGTISPQAWQTTYNNGSDFTAVTKLVSLQNLHLVDLQSGALPLPAAGNMLRPPVSAYYDVANISQCVSLTPVAWPLGTSLSGAPVAQYQFNKVIEFNPQGAARIIVGGSSNNLDAIPYCIEIGLQPTNGAYTTTLASGSSGQIAAIQIDGMSGATRIYQP